MKKELLKEATVLDREIFAIKAALTHVKSDKFTPDKGLSSSSVTAVLHLPVSTQQRLLNNINLELTSYLYGLEEKFKNL